MSAAKPAADLRLNRAATCALVALCAAAGVWTWQGGERRRAWSPALHDRARQAAAAQKVDPAKASVSSLCRLPGIGPVMAQHIVDFRREHPLTRPEDLRQVPGIGEITLANLLPHLEFSHGDASTSGASPGDENN